MKKVFEAPVVEVCNFDVEVIMTSSVDDETEAITPTPGPNDTPIL